MLGDEVPLAVMIKVQARGCRERHDKVFKR
jgi:hypothetical protein